MQPQIEVQFTGETGKKVARLTVCNAAKLNILGSTLMHEMIDALTALARDADLRALVVAGDGQRATIGGADIAEMAALDAKRSRTFITLLHSVCDAVRSIPVPVIARLQGYTLGAGLEIAAACDLRVAATGARFGMPEVRVGIPSVIEAALLPSLIGWGRTRRMLYTGALIDAATALDWGLVEEVVPDNDLDIAIDRLLSDILAGGPQAMRLQKALIREWEGLAPEAAIARGIDCFQAAWQTDEPVRMMTDFLAAKRRQSAGRNPA